MIISHSHARANASPLATGRDDGALRLQTSLRDVPTTLLYPAPEKQSIQQQQNHGADD
jgi:hypothetical protein